MAHFTLLLRTVKSLNNIITSRNGYMHVLVNNIFQRVEKT